MNIIIYDDKIFEFKSVRLSVTLRGCSVGRTLLREKLRDSILQYSLNADLLKMFLI